jgi:plastocyanin
MSLHRIRGLFTCLSILTLTASCSSIPPHPTGGVASGAVQAESPSSQPDKADAPMSPGASPAIGTPQAEARGAMAEPAPGPVAMPVRSVRRPDANPVGADSKRVSKAESKLQPAATTRTATATSSLSGHLELASTGTERVEPDEIVDGLVYFLPKSGSPAPKPGSYSIKTRSKGFSPALLVVPAGSSIRFPNTDTILHNVYSQSPGNQFELGLYGPGQTRETVLRKPGLVIVSCNVHHNMRANVVVLATPYYARPDNHGRFELKNLPPGPGTLVFWHPRAAAQSQAVTLPSAVPVVRKLTAIKPRIAMSMSEQ